MTRLNSYWRGPRCFRRESGRQRISGNVFLIVTEGVKTEPQYLEALRRRLELSSAQIVVAQAGGTDPVTIVDYAVQRKKQNAKLAKNGIEVAFDEVWVVFDTEGPQSGRAGLMNSALQRAKAKKIKVALSNPCYEFWILLHQIRTTSSFADCDAVVKRIKDDFLTGYTKKQDLPMDKLIPVIPTAVDNAAFCRKHHADTGGDGNPSTDVDLLVRAMNDATRAHLRIPLPA